MIFQYTMFINIYIYKYIYIYIYIYINKKYCINTIDIYIMIFQYRMFIYVYITACQDSYGKCSTSAGA